MLKKLRVKFIALNMATVAVVLAVVFTAICVIDYQQSVARVHETLDAALAHAGDAGGGPSSGTQPGAQVPADAARANGMPPEIGGKRGGSDPAIPVAVFSVEADGSLAAVQTRTTASIADDVLAQAAAALADQPDGSGSLDGLGLFYEKRTVGDAAYLAFADMNAASSWQTLAVTLAGVGAAALAAFFVISMFFSRWALAPVDRAWRQQRRFVADASHDLKTPLTVILANTSILLEHPERSIASQSQWIESTQHEAQQMQGLVGDLLLLAQVDEGAAPPPMERLDLTDLVEGELLQFESVAFERAVDLQSQLDESVMVRGNAMSWRCTTPASPSRPRISPTCSTASTAPTRRARATKAATAWGWPSRTPSPRSTAATSLPPATTSAAPRSPSRCPPCPPDDAGEVFYTGSPT